MTTVADWDKLVEPLSREEILRHVKDKHCVSLFVVLPMSRRSSFTPASDLAMLSRPKFPIGASGTLSVTGVTPNSGGNAGTVSPAIYGTGFHNGATAQLNCGQGILGQNSVVSANGRLLNITFDLTSRFSVEVQMLS